MGACGLNLTGKIKQRSRDDRRKDNSLATHIDLALYTATIFGTRSGATELATSSVPIEVALRVLLYPKARRATAVRLETLKN